MKKKMRQHHQFFSVQNGMYNNFEVHYYKCSVTRREMWVCRRFKIQNKITERLWLNGLTRSHHLFD